MTGVLVLFGFPVVFFLVLDAVVYRKPPAWLRAALDGVERRLHPPPTVPFDPFDALKIQHRLATLAAEIQRLEDDSLVFAKAHRIHVAQSAYDAVLGEACRLAGVEDADGRRSTVLRAAQVDPGRRARDELELVSRGWSW
jgi:hypothetical protein